MRRPLKPFVTEYKQSPRRGPAQNSEQSFFESEKPPERAPPPRLFDLASNESEDSYEAAMRAADALFSLPGNGKGGDASKLAQQSAPPAQPKAMSAERQAPNVERTPVPSPVAAPEKSAGRILRAIDEAPDPKLLALEAEHAPKRRGRKPGSKNKPKPALTTAVALAFEPVELPDAFEEETVAPAYVATPAPVARPAAIPALAIPTSNAAASPMPGAQRGDKKFPWVRDRLRPGEDWKRRRLPRVCW